MDSRSDLGPLKAGTQEFIDMFETVFAIGQQVAEIKDEGQDILKTDFKKLDDILQTAACEKDTGLSDKIEHRSNSLRHLQTELDETVRKEASLGQQVKEKEDKLSQLKKDMEEQVKQSNSQPSVRYSVNLYRDISKIRWSEPNGQEIKGYICKKSGTKTFKFDNEKQSDAFIVNSLWTMADTV